MDRSHSNDDRDLYRHDFDRWAKRQAAHLREGRHDLLDTDNLIEEIESLGQSQFFALRSSYALVTMHLLKQIEQPKKASRSRENTDRPRAR